jgi:hypothetical protein
MTRAAHWFDRCPWRESSAGEIPDKIASLLAEARSRNKAKRLRAMGGLLADARSRGDAKRVKAIKAVLARSKGAA